MQSFNRGIIDISLTLFHFSLRSGVDCPHTATPVSPLPLFSASPPRRRLRHPSLAQLLRLALPIAPPPTASPSSPPSLFYPLDPNLFALQNPNQIALQNPPLMFQRSIFGSALRTGICRQASRFHGSLSSRSLTGVSQNANACSGLRNIGMKLGLVRIMENVSLPHARSFSSFIPPGKQTEFGGAGRMSGSMDYIQGLLQERGNEMNEHRPLPQIETNADVVHIKLMRNNAFVTVTDSRGNKKLGISAGKMAGRGGKLTRYYGDAAAEDIGRKVRQMRTKSVVVKVNGFCFFKKKKDAILSFKDGFSNSEPNVNPVMYIEDTTRKPHNGCRLPKRRRL